MLLLVDVGNTQTVIGVHDGRCPAENGTGNYRAIWRLSTQKYFTADDLLTQLQPLFAISDIGLEEISRGAVATVVPNLKISWQHAIKKAWGADATCCTSSRAHELGLFDADYPHPSEIGSDRVADAIAARQLYGSPVVVVDFGTATNIEVIDDRGKFIGGIIAPGIITGGEALFSKATLLASTGFVLPKNPIGKSTSTAVQSGVLYGEIARVDGLLEMIFDELGTHCPVVATGGLSHTISSRSKYITEVRKELTLDGLRILAETVEEKERGGKS